MQVSARHILLGYEERHDFERKVGKRQRRPLQDHKLTVRTAADEVLRVHLYEGLVRHRWELLWHIEATVLRETLQDAFGEAQFRRDPTGADVSHIFAARPSDVAIRMYLSIYLDTRAR